MNEHNTGVRILVLDANQRSALAATRSLGRAGYTVIAGDEHRFSLAGASRYCRQELQYPSPYRAPYKFLEWITTQYRRATFDVALPMTEVTTDLLTRNRAEWPKLILPFAPIEAIDSLSDKVLLYERAMELGVPVPESVVVRTRSDLDSAIRKIGFPAFIKPRRSRLWLNGSFVSTSVRRVDSIEQLLYLYDQPQFRSEWFLYQRPAAGSGRGVFALFEYGRPVAFFSHRRLREKPPAGGVSVLSESCEVDPQLHEYAARLLGSVRWHGVAMVEFKGNSEAAKLMEVNARFWGSLQLAIDAGIDFPALLVKLAIQPGRLSIPTDYRSGVRLRWLLGDLDRLYLVLREKASFEVKLRAILDFLRPDLLRTRHEVFRWNDPRPSLREAIQYVGLSPPADFGKERTKVSAPPDSR